MIKRLLLLAVLLALLPLARLSAQVEDAPAGIPVRIWAQALSGDEYQTTSYSYYVSTTYYGSEYFFGPIVITDIHNVVTIYYVYRYPDDYNYVNSSLEVSGSFLPSLPSDPNPTDGHVGNGTAAGSPDDTMTVNLGIVRVAPGATYTVNVDLNNITGGALNVQAPPGYRVVLDGMNRNSCPLSSSIHLRIVPLGDGIPGTAGFASNVAGLKVDWRVALGSLRNGDSAGWLGLADTGMGSDWLNLFTPGALSYEATSDEVFVYRVNNAVRQIIANQVAVDVVTLNSTSYEIRCYNPAQIQSYVPCTFSGQPFAVYRIARGATDTSLVFTKETRNIPDPNATNVPVARRETMTLARSGNWPSYVWTRQDWTLEGQAALTQTVVQSAGPTAHRTEAITLGTPGGAATLKLARTYDATSPFGEVLAAETLGTSTGLTTGFNYYTAVNQPGNFGYLKSVSLPGGGWEAYDYYDSSILDGYAGGRVKFRYRPFGNAPTAATLDPTLGETSYYEYGPDPFGFMTRPTLTASFVNGVQTARSTTSYAVICTNYVVAATRHDYTGGASDYLETITKFCIESYGDAFIRGKPFSIQRPDGTKQMFIYERGIWNGTTFFPIATLGLSSRITTIAGSANGSAGTMSDALSYGAYNPAWDPLYLVDGKSTKTVTLRDERALVVRTESYVWIGGAWQLVSYVNYGYNFAGLLISQTASNGATSTVTYDGLLKTSDTDASGVTTNYLYDAAGRVTMATRAGSGTIPSVTTRYSYDAVGNVLEQRVGQVEQLVTTKSYDDAGRPTAETPPGLGTSTHAYDVANRTHTVTRPDGSTIVDTTSRDGRPVSHAGTSVVAQYTTYGVEVDGRTWTQVNSGTATSPRYQKVWKDWLGRETHNEHPGFASQQLVTEDKTYEAGTGHLLSDAKSGYAPTLYAYDILGNVVRSGLDVNNSGTLDLASLDRIADSDQWVELYNGAYWSHAESKTYPTANSTSAITTSVKRTRLTGFSSLPAGRLSETQTTDVEGNVTTQTTDVNRATATTTVTTTSTGLAHPQIDIQVAGLATSSTSFDGLTTTVGYDALLRKHTVTDSRNNTTTMAYVAGTALVLSVTDATGAVVATNTYDALGRTTSVTDAAGYAAYSSYNLRSQLIRQWGAATYPVEYGYDAAYGDRTSMSTFRDTSVDFHQSHWPYSSYPSPAGDTTTWAFDPATGLLTTKTDALGRAVTQTYNLRGQTATRTLARGVTTSFAYDANTGELLSQTYSDTTPAVTYTYNRQGKVATVADVTDTRTLGYDSAKPWRFVSESFGAFYDNRVETRLYETGGIIGRVHGFQVGSAAGSNADVEETFAYTVDGRFNALTSGRNADAALRTFRYGYEPNSALLKTLSVDGTAFTVTRTFETQRDLLTSADTQWSTASVSRYDYTSNNLGQRVTLKQSGSAFSDYGDANTLRSFAYDARGELTSDTGYLGAAIDDTKKLPGRAFEFAYDTIGNRQSANHTGVSALRDNYTANALNQYVTKENNVLAVSGTADAGANVVVSSRTTAAARQGRFWSDEVTLPNSLSPWRGPVSIFAGKTGTDGTNLVGLDSRMVQVAAALQAFTYDQDGNLTSDGVWDYQWDAENRLIALETDPVAQSAGLGHHRFEFRYDYLGRRVLKRSLSWNLSLATWHLDSEHCYLYDGWNLIAEYSIQNSTFSLLHSYTWGLDIVRSLTDAGGVGALLQIADHASGKTYLPTYDGNGNVATLLNADTGALAAAYEYSPYGEPLRSQTFDPTIADQPFRFSTKFTDAETGLVYYGHRYYSPSLGRFINRDPKKESGGLNLYGFCGNNGINRWDYLGNWAGDIASGAPSWVKDIIIETMLSWAGRSGCNRTSASSFDNGSWLNYLLAYSSSCGTLTSGLLYTVPTANGGTASSGATTEDAPSDTATTTTTGSDDDDSNEFGVYTVTSNRAGTSGSWSGSSKDGTNFGNVYGSSGFGSGRLILSGNDLYNIVCSGPLFASANLTGVLSGGGPSTSSLNQSLQAANPQKTTMAGLKNDITNVLQELDKLTGSTHLFSNAAVTLLLATAAQESGGLQWRTQLGGGPGLGLFQMDKDTYNDLWDNYLAKKSDLADAIRLVFTPVGGSLSFDMIQNNDAYAAVMARLRYAAGNNDPLPDPTNPAAMADYWKTYYNRGSGANTDQFIGNFNKYVAPILDTTPSGGGGGG
jgi:RHS repeat-associated protein